MRSSASAVRLGVYEVTLCHATGRGMSGKSESTGGGESSPDTILRIGMGFIGSRFLLEASELNLFEKLGSNSMNLAEIAGAISLPERTARILVDGISALGLIEKDSQGRYRNGPAAMSFLTGRFPADLNPMLRFWSRFEYRDFERLGRVLKRPAEAAGWNVPAEQQELFSTAVQSMTAGVANALPGVYDFSQHRSVADLGGGTGSLLVPICSRYPELECTLFEIPNTARVARDILAKRSTGSLPLAARIRVVEGDLMKDPVPGGHDAYILSSVIHVFSPEHARDLLRNVRRSVSPGARLLLIDFWMTEDYLAPLPGPLMAGVFLLRSGEGDVYRVSDVKGWLEETGWKFREHKAVSGPQSLIIAEA